MGFTAQRIPQLLAFTPEEFHHFHPLPLKNSTVPQPGGMRILNGIAQSVKPCKNQKKKKLTRILCRNNRLIQFEFATLLRQHSNSPSMHSQMPGVCLGGGGFLNFNFARYFIVIKIHLI